MVLLLKCKRAKDSFENQRIILKKIKATLSNSTPKFVGFRQQVITSLLMWLPLPTSYIYQDAHELLNMCLDQLKEDVQLPGNHSNDSAHRKTDAKNNDAMNLISPVVTNFESSMEHKIVCKGCVFNYCPPLVASDNVSPTGVVMWPVLVRWATIFPSSYPGKLA